MVAITCINCGIEGVLKASGLQNEDSLKIFRRVGRNHVSGHFHYQCPACKMVLLVDPSLIRENAHIFAKKSTNYPIASSVPTYDHPRIYHARFSFGPPVPVSTGSGMR